MFGWVDRSWLSLEIGASTWQFAVIDMVHLIGLTMLLGSLMVLDLRLWGLGYAACHVKMLLLFLAVVFQFALFGRATNARQESGLLPKFASVLSLILWFGAGLAGNRVSVERKLLIPEGVTAFYKF